MGNGQAMANAVERTGAEVKKGGVGDSMGVFASRTLRLFAEASAGLQSSAHGDTDRLLSIPLDDAIARFAAEHGFTTPIQLAWARLFVTAYRRAATLGAALEIAMREADRSDERRHELLEVGALLRDAELSVQDSYAALFDDRRRHHRDQRTGAVNNCSERALKAITARAQGEEE